MISTIIGNLVEWSNAPSPDEYVGWIPLLMFMTCIALNRAPFCLTSQYLVCLKHVLCLKHVQMMLCVGNFYNLLLCFDLGNGNAFHSGWIPKRYFNE